MLGLLIALGPICLYAILGAIFESSETKAGGLTPDETSRIVGAGNQAASPEASDTTQAQPEVTPRKGSRKKIRGTLLDYGSNPTTSSATPEEVDDDEPKKKTRQQIEANYRRFLKSPNKCETKHWNRYEFGRYFQELANRNKITAWDVVNGDSYTRRNISALVRPEISDNYIKYVVYHLPEAAKEKFELELSEKEKEKNEAAVFNALIRRDYECYKKLK